MKNGDIYICINNDEVLDNYKIIKFQKYVIINSMAELDYCYIASTTIIDGIIIKCLKSNLATAAEYRKLKIDNLL